MRSIIEMHINNRFESNHYALLNRYVILNSYNYCCSSVVSILAFSRLHLYLRLAVNVSYYWLTEIWLDIDFIMKQLSPDLDNPKEENSSQG